MKRTMKRGLLTLAVAGFVGASALGVSSVVSLAEGEEKIFRLRLFERTYLYHGRHAGKHRKCF